MARNKVFHPDQEPLRHDDSLQLDSNRTSGPFAFLNPTRAHFQHLPTKSQDAKSSTPSSDVSTNKDASNVEFRWTSRNNRKGRHAIAVKPDSESSVKTPEPSTSGKAIIRGILRMATYYPFWDVSWLVAVIFTIGSVIWVINAFFVFLPLTNPNTEFNGESLYGGGITAFIGATVFELGSALLMLEAINENRTGDFGWALEQVYEGHIDHEGGSTTRLVPSREACSHHHPNTKNLVGKPADTSLSRAEKTTEGSASSDGRSWRWCPSAHDLRTKYIHDLGFLACGWQMFGATVFWISGFTALPGIYNHLSPAALNGAFWAVQVIGGFGFVVSGTLFMIETQKHWWLPAPNVLGWHIGLWNLIGGVGFFICPIFGFNTASWSQFQSSCSTFWGKTSPTHTLMEMLTMHRQLGILGGQRHTVV